MTSLFKGKGTLHYAFIDGVGYRLVLNIDQGIVNFYRSLIPKWFNVIPQKYNAHISVVRKETPKNLEFWKAYEGQVVEFLYDVDIQHDHQYWWLNCYSHRLEEIRQELGLSNKSLYSIPTEGFEKVFHTTIANNKGKI